MPQGWAFPDPKFQVVVNLSSVALSLFDVHEEQGLRVRTALPSRRASCRDVTEHLRRLYLIKTPATGISGETSEVLVNKFSWYPMFHTLKPFGCCLFLLVNLLFSPCNFGADFRGILMGQACS